MKKQIKSIINNIFFSDSGHNPSDISEMSWFYYIWLHLVFSLVGCFMVSGILSMTVKENIQYNYSFRSSFVCFLLCSVIGIALSFNDRCLMNIIQSILYGSALNLVIAFWKYIKFYLPVFSILIFFIFYIGTLIILYLKLRRIRKISKTHIKECIKSITSWLSILLLVLALSASFLPTGLNLLSETETINSNEGFLLSEDFDDESVDLLVNSYYSEYKIPKNIDNLRYIINQDDFRELNYQKQTEIIESVVYWEANRLGLDKLNVSFEYLNENWAGCYIDAEKSIKIDKRLFEEKPIDVDYIVHVALHETYHAYQISLANVYDILTPEQRALKLFDNHETHIQSWYENEKNYTNSVEDLDAYRLQALEMDAELFANQESNELKNEIIANYYVSEY